MIRDLSYDEFPPLLKEINDPPKSLRFSGELPIKENKLLCIVGSRKYSEYGRESIEEIIKSLRSYPITIVSGLALGIDSIAHRAAIRANLQTISVPGSGLGKEVLYPRSNLSLAEEIIENGGGLLSEFPDDFKPQIWSFPKRNRIMAGMCEATIIVEAELKSGTLITSRLATEYNRDVGAIPGPIDSPLSEGSHMLIRLGATLIRNHKDVLELLKIKPKEEDSTLFDMDDLTEEEKIFINILEIPCPRDELIRKSKLDTGNANGILSLMEIKGLITEELGEVRKTF